MARQNFASKIFDVALSEFQWVSVFGFFSHVESKQYEIAKNLARAYEEYLKSQGEPLDLALAWAHEAQRLEDTPDIRAMIVRLSSPINTQ